MGWFTKKDKPKRPAQIDGEAVLDAVKARAVEAPLTTVAMNTATERAMRAAVGESIGARPSGLPPFFGASIDGITIERDDGLPDGELVYR